MTTLRTISVPATQRQSLHRSFPRPAYARSELRRARVRRNALREGGKRESRGFRLGPWVPAFAGTSGKRRRFLATSAPSRPALDDRIGDRHRAPRNVGVQPLDHAAVERDDAFVPVLRQVECGEDRARLRYFFLAWRERRITGRDLV